MTTRAVKPQPFLQPFVRSFSFRESVVTDVLRFPIPARPEQFIEFYLRDRYRLIDFASGEITSAPRVVVLGQQTRRHRDLYLQGDYANFTIDFHPTGFHRLFGVPMSELADQAISAESVLGGKVNRLHEQLQQATTLTEWVRLAEQFLLPQALRAAPIQPATRVAQSILSGHGGIALDRLRAASGLSLRQLERQFDRSVGVTPKRFARIVRFQHAVTLGRIHGDGQWTRIAAEAGYFDQTHLIKDFAEFSAQTPILLQQAVCEARSWDPLRETDAE